MLVDNPQGLSPSFLCSFHSNLYLYHIHRNLYLYYIHRNLYMLTDPLQGRDVQPRELCSTFCNNFFCNKQMNLKKKHMLYIHVIAQSGGWILTTGATLHTDYTAACHRHEMKEHRRKALPSSFLLTLLTQAAIPSPQPEQALVQRLDWGGVETTRQSALN